MQIIKYTLVEKTDRKQISNNINVPFWFLTDERCEQPWITCQQIPPFFIRIVAFYWIRVQGPIIISPSKKIAFQLQLNIDYTQIYSSTWAYLFSCIVPDPDKRSRNKMRSIAIHT